MRAVRTALLQSFRLRWAAAHIPLLTPSSEKWPQCPDISCVRKAILSVNGVVGVVIDHPVPDLYNVGFETAHGVLDVSITS
jgi:hypothetical protein